MLRSIAAATALLLTACAPTTGPRTAIDRELANVVNPSAVIATELAFARTAREEGQWTAFREYAAGDAVMFVPQAVQAQDWLRGRTDPAQAVQWQPHAVWMSCDGSLAVTRGAAQWPDGRPGSFVTVWERQRDGGYKWVLDRGEFVERPLPVPDFIQTEVAKCAGTTSAAAVRPQSTLGPPASTHQRTAKDQSLTVADFAWQDGRSETWMLITRDGGTTVVDLGEHRPVDSN